MATLTISATSFETAFADGSGWNTNASGYANQGCYGNGPSRVGVIVFGNLGGTLAGATISSITFKPTITAGSALPNRTITLYSSNYQYVDTSISGGSYPKSKLGTLVGNGTQATGTASTWPGEQSFVLNSSTNSALFNALASYLSAGNSCLLLYNGETTNASGYNYSANFLAFTGLTMVITYTAANNYVYIDNGSGFEAYQVYIDNGTSWDLYEVYIDNGTSWDKYG